MEAEGSVLCPQGPGKSETMLQVKGTPLSAISSHPPLHLSPSCFQCLHLSLYQGEADSGGLCPAVA